jgi:hypothetical protein
MKKRMGWLMSATITLHGVMPVAFFMLVSLHTTAATVTFTGASGIDKKFSTTANWTAFPASGDIAHIAITNTSGMAMMSTNPALLDSSMTLGTLRVYSQTGYGLGRSYMKIKSGGKLTVTTVAIGNPGNAAFDGMLTLASGGSLSNAYPNSGSLTIGGDTDGMYGRLIAESGAVFRQTSLTLCTNGTLVYVFGTNAVSTLTTTRSTAGATNILNGRIVVDLSALTTGGSYTLIDSSSTNLLLQGALYTWLSSVGGARSGDGSYQDNHFVVLNGNNARWTLCYTNGQQDLVLNITILPVQSFGKGTAFYRNTQLQGHLVSNGLWLVDFPDYLTSGCDLPFLSRGSLEVPMVDRFSVTRYLGGFPTNWASSAIDLAYTNSSGAIQYRWNLVPGRLQPYMTNGYAPADITLVLDNVPWDIAAYYDQDAYGNTAPPRNWTEWKTFVQNLCGQLSSNYSSASDFRFKMGTEYNSIRSFSGTQEDYFKYYDYAAAGIQAVFPSAFIMPSEIGGGFNAGNVNYYELVDHCMDEINFATGQVGTPLYGFARSSHCFGGKEIDPRERLGSDIWTFDCLLGRSPGLAREDMKLEIHQFNWLNNEFGANSRETGGRGAAWTFMYLMGMKEQGLLDGCWHWQVLDEIRAGSPYKYLPIGEGWMYNILDRAISKDVYLLDVPAQKSDGTFFCSTAAVGTNETYIITASFNTNRTIRTGNWVDIVIPKAIKDFPSGVTVEQLHYDDEFSVHQKIRDDLATATNLTAVYADHPYTLGTVDQMAINKTTGWKMVTNNWSSYQNTMYNSLNFGTFDMANYSEDATNQVFHVWLRSTAVGVVRIKY